MPFVITQPEPVMLAAGNAAGSGSVMSAGNAVDAGLTTDCVPAAADEVSAGTATRFAAHAALDQTIGAQTATTHDLCVAASGISADSYAAIEPTSMVAL
ncbi:PE family protein [Mycobacterium sp. SM1]|uniref:PE family protein n=1 Tax=Mycobacterium sp. SM1 TaxID=2816243 RepID=UPI001BCABDAE|nr:PE family protein [Mycobacterium sp. SM1]MBS4729923.1 PE family protein [Mycobacterium sp. SM1]